MPSKTKPSDAPDAQAGNAPVSDAPAETPEKQAVPVVTVSVQSLEEVIAATQALITEAEKRLGSSNVAVVKARAALAAFAAKE